jgi:hypothetical protein
MAKKKNPHIVRSLDEFIVGQGSRVDRVQVAAEIGSIVHEPTRHSREGEEILWAPEGGAASRARKENKRRHPARLVGRAAAHPG